MDRKQKGGCQGLGQGWGVSITLNGSRVSVWDDNVPGTVVTATRQCACVHLKPLTGQLKMVKMVNLILHIFCHHFKELKLKMFKNSVFQIEYW